MFVSFERSDHILFHYDLTAVVDVQSGLRGLAVQARATQRVPGGAISHFFISISHFNDACCLVVNAEGHGLGVAHLVDRDIGTVA